MKLPHTDGVAFKLCIHFARNPGAAMFADDVTKKWGVPNREMCQRFKSARDAGLVEWRWTGDGERYFTAGPALLEML